ncbi:MAG TPA: type II toxin-antitoxin system prevent-host-death family antitoxin [Isosphaeraceae bacterium]|nr:type II toxin-antitoxin system prevent-host-death family antitoxin [Isosphaeraceae bacterium]
MHRQRRTRYAPVSVSELRARLSRYLRAVEYGRTILITDRGHLIARIVPFDDPLERAISLGLVSEPKEELDDEFFDRGPSAKDPKGSLRRLVAEGRGGPRVGQDG